MKEVLVRDDLICNTEQDVLGLVLTYINNKLDEQFASLKKELMPCVRFD